MKGYILSSELTDNVAARRERGERFLNGTYRTGKNTVAKTDRVSSFEGGYVGDIRVLENGGTTIQDAGLPSQQSESEQSGDFAPIRRDLSWEEIEAKLKQILEEYKMFPKDKGGSGKFSTKDNAKVDADKAVTYKITEYKKIAKEIAKHGRSGKIREVQGLAGSTGRIDLINKRSYSLGREGAGIDRDETQYVGENRQVQRMGEGTDEGRERAGRDSGGDRESGGTDRQGDPVTVTREGWLV